MIVAGLDLSKNHYALYLESLKDGHSAVSLTWPSKAYVGTHQEPTMHREFLVRAKGRPESRESSWSFAVTWARIFAKRIRWDTTKFAGKSSVIFSIEDVAYNQNPIIVRGLTLCLDAVLLTCWRCGWPVRMHDPKSVKMMAGNGNYDKNQMVAEAKRAGLLLPARLQKASVDSVSDIADAYFLAQMLKSELLVRKDPQHVKVLSENERKLFNRVTTAYPENLLVREFIARAQPKL